MTGHALTFRVAPEDAERGITARCLTCGRGFRNAEEWVASPPCVERAA